MRTLDGMRSLFLIALASVVVAIIPPAASQSATTTEIPLRTEKDNWEKEGRGPVSRSYSAGNPEAESDDRRSRAIVLTVDRTRWPVERIQISIVDQHLRDTLLFGAEGWELLKLKELVDKAVADYRADRESLRGSR